MTRRTDRWPVWPAMTALAMLGCATPIAPPPGPPPAASSAPLVTAEPVACCTEYSQVQALDKHRVVVEGMYRPVLMQKRVGPLPPAPPGAPASVAIEMAPGPSVMLEIYYESRGRRSVEEIARFSGKRVRVTGTLHARTPSQNVEGQTMQTMIGPYIGEIESVEEVAAAQPPTQPAAPSPAPGKELEDPIVWLAFDRSGAVLRAFGYQTLTTADGGTGRTSSIRPYGADGRFVFATHDGGRVVVRDASGVMLIDTSNQATQRLPQKWLPTGEFHPEHEVSLSEDLRYAGVYGCLRPSCEKPMVVEVYDLATKRSVARRTSDFIAAGGDFSGGVSQDGRFIEFLNNRTSRVLVNLKTGRPGPTFGAQSVRSPDGRVVLDLPNIIEPGNIRILDGATGRPMAALGTIQEDDNAYVHNVAFCGSVRVVVASASEIVVHALPGGQKVHTLAVQQWQEIAVQEGEDRYAPVVACTDKGDRVAIAGKFGLKVLPLPPP